MNGDDEGDGSGDDHDDVQRLTIVEDDRCEGKNEKLAVQHDALVNDETE